MKNLIELSHTEVVLAFAASCIESTARHLGKSYQEIFTRMNRVRKYLTLFVQVGVLSVALRFQRP